MACGPGDSAPALRRLLSAIVPAALLLSGAGCGGEEGRVTRGSIRIGGSDAALRLVRAEADSFAAQYPKARIVVEGGGSVAGLEALLNREADAAVVSRPPTDAERDAARRAGVEVALYPFAHDGLAVIVNAASPVYALSFPEAHGVFSGAVTDWAELGAPPGPIRLYVTGVQGGAEWFVREALLDGAPFAGGAGRAPTTAAAVESVAAHEDAIGYAGMAELDGRVKALPLSPKDGGPLTVLNVETVYRKTYPLVRTFAFATRGIPRDDLVSGFVSFVMSTRGQRIVLEAGLVPATVPLRIRRGEPASPGTPEGGDSKE